MKSIEVNKTAIKNKKKGYDIRTILSPVFAFWHGLDVDLFVIRSHKLVDFIAFCSSYTQQHCMTPFVRTGYTVTLFSASIRTDTDWDHQY